MSLIFFISLFFAGAASVAGQTCDINRSACTKAVNGGTVTLDIHPRPVKAMEELAFTVTLSGIMPVADPYIDLGMPGMHMGPNKVRLTRTGDRLYEGKGLIVRCPSGRRTWRAAVTVPGSGAADFVFDVIY